MSTRSRLFVSLAATLATLACAAPPSQDDRGRPDGSARNAALGGPLQRGREIWLENTYGGEKFFAFLAAHPDPTRRVRIAFEEVVTTPRSDRFAEWGTINDPDCIANPAGGADLCADPEATGVVGIRKFPGPGGTTLYGVSCASCHVGFDPRNPPEDAAEPSWSNLHMTIGNQYLKSGKIFAANMAPADPRRIMFAAWPDGTVDTTLLFNDQIMNPGVITAFWEQKHRPLFDAGVDDPQMRSGQGGEDDLGGVVAAMRVYTNIGVCFQECIAPRPDRPDPSAPIDVAQCRADCADFPPDEDLEDLSAFLRSVKSPRYPGVPVDGARYAHGRNVFESACSSCHVTHGEGHKVLSDDEVRPLDAQATNACRALTTNWDAGRLWAPFSSDTYKSRGFKGYRTMPLTGIWATSPLLHNQSIGDWPSATASPDERAAVWRDAMRELMSASRPPKVNTLPVAVGPFPPGTPLAYVFSRDPATGAVLCTDVVENRGHTWGADLPEADREALIEWLQYQ